MIPPPKSRIFPEQPLAHDHRGRSDKISHMTEYQGASWPVGSHGHGSECRSTYHWRQNSHHRPNTINTFPRRPDGRTCSAGAPAGVPNSGCPARAKMKREHAHECLSRSPVRSTAERTELPGGITPPRTCEDTTPSGAIQARNGCFLTLLFRDVSNWVRCEHLLRQRLRPGGKRQV